LDYDTNQEAIKYGLDYMHTPETYFINFMRLGYFDKYTILKDNKSILPPVNSSIQVLSTETIDLDDSNYSWITSQFWDYTRNAKSVTRIYYSVTTTDIDRNNGFVEVTTTYYYSAYVVNSFTKSRVLLSIKNEDGLDIYSWTCETYNKYVIQGAKYEEETETSTEEETSIENASIDEDIENNEVKIEDVEETSKTEESSSNAIVIEEVITN
jgi:hypothetical protein